MTAVWVVDTGKEEIYVLAESEVDAAEAAQLMGHDVKYVEHYSDDPEDLPS